MSFYLFLRDTRLKWSLFHQELRVGHKYMYLKTELSLWKRFIVKAFICLFCFNFECLEKPQSQTIALALQRTGNCCTANFLRGTGVFKACFVWRVKENKIKTEQKAATFTVTFFFLVEFFFSWYTQDSAGVTRLLEAKRSNLPQYATCMVGQTNDPSNRRSRNSSPKLDLTRIVKRNPFLWSRYFDMFSWSTKHVLRLVPLTKQLKWALSWAGLEYSVYSIGKSTCFFNLFLTITL